MVSGATTFLSIFLAGPPVSFYLAQCAFTMFCSRDDVVLLPIPFTDLSSSKVRPAIVVGMAVGRVIFW
jgi:hypothetical protein